MIRYSVIREKNPREIVLLRGRGCIWRACTFCDYHLDACRDEQANLVLNREVLSRVTGCCGRLEVINSGSFPELDPSTLGEVEETCRERHIRHLHVESHWLYRETIPALREHFRALGVTLHVKIGVETFDAPFREQVLRKGIPEADPARIAAPFDECCLLFGLTGQTEESMERDLETGLACFDRVCVNLMTENSTPVRPDPQVLELFRQRIWPRWQEDPRVDILLSNTGFGVGGEVP